MLLLIPEEALREDWCDRVNHMAFADWLSEEGFDDESLIHAEWTPEKQDEAEEWLQDFADSCSDPQEEDPESTYVEYRLGYDDLIEAAISYQKSGDDFCNGTDTPDIAFDRMDEFWKHFQVVIGIPVPEAKRVPFIHCAC